MADWRSLGLDFVTLRVFKAAVEEQSFVSAAEREHLAASAISRRIADLEARLGIELLRRHDRGVELTPAGKVLMRHVKSLFDIVEVTLSDLESLTLGRSGEVRVSASLSAISSTLPRIIGEIKAEHPNLDLRLEQNNSEETLVSLHRGTADIGFVSGIDVVDGLTSFEILAEPLRVVLPRSHALATRSDGLKFADLTEVDYIGLRKDLALQQLISRKAIGHDMQMRITVTVDGFESLAKYVAMGMGVSIMPKFHADDAAKAHGVVAVPLLEEWAERKTHVCVKSIASLSPASKIVLEAILGEKIGELKGKTTAKRCRGLSASLK